MRALLLAFALALLAAGSAHAQVTLPTPPPPGGGEEPPPPPPPAVEPGPPGDVAVADGIDAARRSATGDASIVPPFGVLWAHDLGSTLGHPLIVEGRVIVVRAARTSSEASTLEALDAATGRRQWSRPLGTVDGAVTPAYGDGRLLIVDRHGVAIAVSVATGDEVWRAETDYLGGTGRPVVAGDTLYVQGQRVHALDVATGAHRWTASLDLGTGTPAVAGDRLYVHGGCDVAALDRRNGSVIWSHNRGCGGGWASPVLLWRDRVVPFEDAETGQRRADSGERVEGPLVEAVVDDVGLQGGFPSPSALTAHDLVEGRVLWRSRAVSDVLGLPGHAFTRESIESGGSALVARDIRSGAERWGARLIPSPDTVLDYLVRPQQAAAGQGIVAVPDGSRLVVLAPASRTRPEPLTMEVAGRADRLFGQRAAVSGRTGNVLGARRTTLQADAHPFRDGFRSLAEAETGTDGGYRHHVGLTRNVRLRVAADDGRTSAVATLYVYPRLRLRIAQRRGLVRARLRIGAPRDLALRGRRVALYIGRPGSRRLRRLDGARAAGRRATFVFRPLRRVHRRAFLLPCLRGAHRLGMGRADVLSRRCGRRVIRF